jgi:hypothetical protein
LDLAGWRAALKQSSSRKGDDKGEQKEGDGFGALSFLAAQEDPPSTAEKPPKKPKRDVSSLLKRAASAASSKAAASVSHQPQVTLEQPPPPTNKRPQHGSAAEDVVLEIPLTSLSTRPQPKPAELKSDKSDSVSRTSALLSSQSPGRPVREQKGATDIMDDVLELMTPEELDTWRAVKSEYGDNET